MKKIIMLIVVVFTTFNLVNAQIEVGAPGGVISFNTNNNDQGGLLGHHEDGTFGTLGSGDQWIGIGQPTFNQNKLNVYGIRTQWDNNAGILALTGTQTNKKLELNWGGPSKTADFEINHITSFTNPNAKTNCMTIEPDGDVGLGTRSPTDRLHVEGGARVNWTWLGSNPNGGGYRDGITGLYSLHLNANRKDNVGGNIVFLVQGSQKMIMNRYGNLYQSSDKRFKTDIKGIDNALDKINELDGFTYKFKEEKIGEYDFSELEQEKQLGFLAQDIQEVFPELVSQDKEGYLSVNYIGLIPVLVEGLKEQQDIISEQKDEIEDLQVRMEKLESLLSASETTTPDNFSTPTESLIDDEVVLRQNAPNPFSGTTTIEYQLPERLTSASLMVSDLNGRIIANYNISGKGTVQFDAGELDNGVYTYVIIANGKNIAAQKMVIQK